MHYLALLSLIQKNIKALRNFKLLKEEILSSPQTTYEELLRYLREIEPLFFQQVADNKALFQAEMTEILRLKLLGIDFTHQTDKLYPASFVGMPGAPVLFSFRGHPCWVLGRSLAIVGSRDITSLSMQWMEEHITEFLHREKAVLVSGGARGVDQMAHQLALRHRCPTAVVLPSGLGALYPEKLETWQKAIIDGGGCLISEYSYLQKMQKYFFHDRNRLIAGLGALTLLIEARRRSGSLLTAQQTLSLGKNVLVVPGHPMDPSHLGNLDLLCEGASPIRDAEDLCMYFRSELRMPLEAIPRGSEVSLC